MLEKCGSGRAALIKFINSHPRRRPANDDDDDDDGIPMFRNLVASGRQKEQQWPPPPIQLAVLQMSGCFALLATTMFLRRLLAGHLRTVSADPVLVLWNQTGIVGTTAQQPETATASSAASYLASLSTREPPLTRSSKQTHLLSINTRISTFSAIRASAVVCWPTTTTTTSSQRATCPKH